MLFNIHRLYAMYFGFVMFLPKFCACPTCGNNLRFYFRRLKRWVQHSTKWYHRMRRSFIWRTENMVFSAGP